MKRTMFFALLPLAVSPFACSGADSGAMSDPSLRSGAVEIRLVDAPAQDVTEIVVTIDSVDAHVAGSGWVNLTSGTRTIDLLKLQGGSFALLGVAQFPSGHITQLRLHVVEGGVDYVTTPDGVHHPLKVPSGEESGIKIKGGFDWSACAGGNLTLDFDGKKSIFTHPVGGGAGDEWILRPVIRLKSFRQHKQACGDEPGAGEGAAGSTGTAGNSAGATGSASGGTAGGGTSAGGSGGSEATPTPPSDGGGVTTPPLPPDTSDPCTTVMCSDGSVCAEGTCYPLIP